MEKISRRRKILNWYQSGIFLSNLIKAASKEFDEEKHPRNSDGTFKRVLDSARVVGSVAVISTATGLAAREAVSRGRKRHFERKASDIAKTERIELEKKLRKEKLAKKLEENRNSRLAKNGMESVSDPAQVAQNGKNKFDASAINSYRNRKIKKNSLTQKEMINLKRRIAEVNVEDLGDASLINKEDYGRLRSRIVELREKIRKGFPVDHPDGIKYDDIQRLKERITELREKIQRNIPLDEPGELIDTEILNEKIRKAREERYKKYLADDLMVLKIALEIEREKNTLKGIKERLDRLRDRQRKLKPLIGKGVYLTGGNIRVEIEADLIANNIGDCKKKMKKVGDEILSLRQKIRKIRREAKEDEI